MAVQLVLANFAVEGVSVQAKHFGSLALISPGFGERILDELLLELADGFIQVNAFLNHLRN
jgi:hypothetical protein